MHTPGPWYVKKAMDDYWIEYRGGLIAQMMRTKYPFLDAQLVAASPMMLDTLDRIQQRLENFTDWVPMTNQETLLLEAIKQSVADCMQAYLKATGVIKMR